MLHQIKAPQFYTVFRSPKTLLNPPVNGKIQGLLKAFECFSSTFSRQILFSRTFQDSPVYSSNFQVCANPVIEIRQAFRFRVLNQKLVFLNSQPKHIVCVL